MDNKEYALVLEGGGVKCAYQVGAIVALMKNGYSFNIISGASFGAFNGAMFITGGVEQLFSFYNNINLEKMFVDPGLIEIIANNQNDQRKVLPEAIKYCVTSLKYQQERDKAAENYRDLLFKEIDANIIKNSPIDFYCSVLKVRNSPLTIGKLFKSFATGQSLSDLYQNRELEGRIIDKNKENLDKFVIASANYPVFPPYQIGDEFFYDGGIFDNTPYRHLLDKGIKKMIIVRTHNDRPIGIKGDKDNIIIITPSRYLGSTLSFTQENIQELIKLGYLDTEEEIKRINE